MSQTKDNIFKLIAQIKATTISLKADPSDMDRVQEVIQNGDHTEEELLKIQQRLMQTLKDLLIIQDDLIKKLQVINKEMTEIIAVAKNRQAEEEETENVQAQIAKIQSSLK